MKKEFDAVIEEAPGGGAFIEVPFDAKEVFGSGRPRVAAMFDGAAYRGSIASMGDRWVLGVTKAIRGAIGKGTGDHVRVVVEADTAPPETRARRIERVVRPLADRGDDAGGGMER